MRKTISLAQLAKNPEKIAKDIEASGSTYRIRRPGRKAMLLVGQDYFDSWVASLEFIQRHPNWREELKQSELDYKAGLCRPLDEILEELGLDERPANTRRRGAAPRTATNRRASRR
ncbi:MAG TPA: hypothetical protein VFV99_14655 [Kofleriaceae bacterium]|nr:hypothetical protein [Kofleriaceae bacterium]